ncbi:MULTISPECIES: phage tail assembly chaperone GT [Oceanobacillus]|uniref:phage tail assembly chaperone GT n=1 Tax=Oceanobacillus TaxID=182709 RepID=UPI0025A3A469|nr:hypothetical protein [Oceanobacillus oncorhynchi]MDM8098658.1 hypothetical protein [Oceanobacillus oncorhynchi]
MDEDFSPAKQKQYMDNLIHDLMKDGKDINEILNMPYNFVLDILAEKSKPKEEKSLIAAFGGTR